MVEFEVSEEQQQQSWDGFHDDLFVSIDVDPEPHWMQHRCTTT